MKGKPLQELGEYVYDGLSITEHRMHMLYPGVKTGFKIFLLKYHKPWTVMLLKTSTKWNVQLAKYCSFITTSGEDATHLDPKTKFLMASKEISQDNSLGIELKS